MPISAAWLTAVPVLSGRPASIRAALWLFRAILLIFTTLRQSSVRPMTKTRLPLHKQARAVGFVGGDQVDATGVGKLCHVWLPVRRECDNQRRFFVR